MGFSSLGTEQWAAAFFDAVVADWGLPMAMISDRDS